MPQQHKRPKFDNDNNRSHLETIIRECWLEAIKEGYDNIVTSLLKSNVIGVDDLYNFERKGYKKTALMWACGEGYIISRKCCSRMEMLTWTKEMTMDARP